MRTFILVSLFAVFSFSTHAQSRVESVEYQKVQRDAIVADVPFPEKTIAAAISDTLQKLGFKGKDTKGFTLYKGVTLAALGSSAYDLYFSVDRKSKKEKDQSTVTLMISKDFDNFIAEKTEPDIISNAKTYMDSLRNIVAIYDLEQQIQEQEVLVKKNEKKLEDLTDQEKDYEKDRKKLEDKIDTNKKNKAKQISENDVQKQVLLHHLV